MCVCVSAPKAMNNIDTKWCDVTDGRGLSNEACHELLLKKEQGNAVLAFLFVVNSRLTSCTLLTRRSISVLKVGVMCRFQSL